MAEVEQKGRFGVSHFFKANMGNRTASTIRDFSGKRTGVNYANEILEGDLVKITGDGEVGKCAAGEAAIGVAMDDYDHEGSLPTTSATWGNYDNNAIVKVDTFGKVIKTVQLEAANSKIVAGDKIKIGATTAGCYDKGTSTTNAIALEGAAANSGAKIKVLFAVTPI